MEAPRGEQFRWSVGCAGLRGGWLVFRSHRFLCCQLALGKLRGVPEIGATNVFKFGSICSWTIDRGFTGAYLKAPVSFWMGVFSGPPSSGALCLSLCFAF